MKKGKKLTKKRKRKTKSKTKRKDSCNSCKSNKYNSNNNYRLGALALAKEEERIRLILDQQRAFADDFLNTKKRRSSKKTAHVDIISLEIRLCKGREPVIQIKDKINERGGDAEIIDYNDFIKGNVKNITIPDILIIVGHCAKNDIIAGEGTSQIGNITSVTSKELYKKLVKKYQISKQKKAKTHVLPLPRDKMSNSSNNYLDNDNTFPKNIIFYNCNSAEIFCNSFFDNLLHDNHIHTKVYCFNEPVIACTGMGTDKEIDRGKKSNNKGIDNFIHINDWFHHHIHVTKYTVDGLTRKKQTIYELFEELNVSITPEELIEASNSNDE